MKQVELETIVEGHGKILEEHQLHIQRINLALEAIIREKSLVEAMKQVYMDVSRAMAMAGKPSVEDILEMVMKDIKTALKETRNW
jgi:hypothetical protein